MDPADLIEENSEYIALRLDHWIMSHADEAHSPKFDAIVEFVQWCRAEDQKDLDAPRNGLGGTSFRQRREDCPGWWKEPDPKNE